MAAEIQDQLGLAPRLIRGGGGIFEIRREGRGLYSKKQTGRFPAPGEAASLLG